MRTPTVQQILSTHWAEAFKTLGCLGRHTRGVINALIMCRTPMLGAHRYTCSSPECDHSILAPNSCRNRHCPLCQALARAEWLTSRLAQLLPVHYFHIVFTLPSELRPLTKRNRRVVYRIMFRAASETIMTLCADPKRLGGTPGLILMLHTWTQRLGFHPHLHGIIPGGVLAHDKQRWRCAPKKFFLPVAVVAAMFRGKLLAALREAYAEGKITWNSDEFRVLLHALYRKKWHVYLEPSFRNPIFVVKYLAAYTNRVGIGNKRILSLRNGYVRFRYKRRTRNGAVSAVEELPAVEFIGRFVQHILPRGFVKVRYYGLLSNRACAKLLPLCLGLLRGLRPVSAMMLRAAVATQLLQTLVRSSMRLCPVCELGLLQITSRLSPELALAAMGGND